MKKKNTKHTKHTKQRIDHYFPLFFSKQIDRLALELKLDPMEAYERLQRTVERVNALAASLVLNKAVGDDLYGRHEDDDVKMAEDDVKTNQRDMLENEWTFSPEKGNVIFASAIDGWAFNVSDFARMWSPRIKVKPKLLREFLWGNFAYNQKT